MGFHKNENQRFLYRLRRKKKKKEASKFRNRELSLQIKLEELEKRLSANKDDQPLHGEVLRVKQELELITIGKARGAQIRSRIKG